MKVIIPLAGMGKRLRPHTYSKAKPLVHLAGNTVLGHILDDLKDNKDVEELIFITGYLGDQIQEYVDSKYDFKTKYLEQKELKGQAHAIQMAKDYVDDDDSVVVWFVDTISDADISKLSEVEEDGAIYVKNIDDPRRFGQIKSDDNGIVKEIREKADPPVSDLVNIGIYYVKKAKSMFDAIDELIEKDIQTKGEYFLMDAFQIMIGKGAKFKSLEINVWKDCGKPDALLETNRYFLDNGKEKEIDAENSIIIPPVHIEDGAKVKNSVVGPYVSIAEGTNVCCSILKDCIVGKESKIKDANLNESLVGDSAVVKGEKRKLNVGDSSEIDY